MSATIETTIEREESDVVVRVEYECSRGCKGARDSLGGVRGAGPPLEPDEPASVEIISVLSSDGTDYVDDLSENERQSIELECFSDVGDRRDAAEEDRFQK